LSQEESDKSLDLVGGILRLWSQNSFTVGSRDAREVSRDLEAWASHLLLGHARPGAPANEPLRSKFAQRDWPGARQFLQTLRSEEAAYMRQALTDFRTTVQGMVQRVRQAISEERELDTQLVAQLDNLRAAATGTDLHKLRAAAEQAANAVLAVLAIHKTRHAAQENEMTARLQVMGERLLAAEQLADEDALTGLINRRGFDAELRRTAGIGGQFNTTSALLLIDLDHFKEVNDTYGHPGGDAALKLTANILSRSFPRRSDCVARYGGEEFAVILRDSRSGEAARLAQRFVDNLRAVRVRHDDQEFQITASAGVAEMHASESPEGWLARADAGVYAAKDKGRDCCVLIH
jgi:diguanylate cyclase